MPRNNNSDDDEVYQPPTNTSGPADTSPRQTRAIREAAMLRAGFVNSNMSEEDYQFMLSLMPLNFHSDPTKFPKLFQITSQDYQSTSPLEDREVYEIRDYLVKYIDFDLRVPTLATRIRRANADYLSDGISRLMSPFGEHYYAFTCLVCHSWYRPDSEECNQYTCYAPFRDQLAEWAKDHIAIRMTPDRGYGAFMKPGRDVEQDEIIGIYYGMICKHDSEHVPNSAYVYEMDDHIGEYPYNIDAGMYGNWTRFINHHCRPNVACSPETIGGIRVLVFKALRPIEERHEIYVNYGRSYFDKSKMQCRCNLYPVEHKAEGHADTATNKPRTCARPVLPLDQKRELPLDSESDSPLSSPPSTPERSVTPDPGRQDPFRPSPLRPGATSRSGPRHRRTRGKLATYSPASLSKVSSGIRKRQRIDRQASRSYVSGVQEALEQQELIEIVGDAGYFSDSTLCSPTDTDEEMEDVLGYSLGNLGNKPKVHAEPYRAGGQALPDVDQVLREAAPVEAEDYQVEKVMDSTLMGDEVKYLVKWEGWPQRRHWTWEPFEHFYSDGAKAAVRTFHAQQPGKPKDSRVEA
ncbi:hypothetical protein QC762_0077720 [Podospora pseudocomata]|uniref:SET domain-containing protein n=1 Tax=Podospora pseudocomata TaxID=2093779 RepID=A0ABR0GAU6_9PEZI|nr:hypothetical protein QC762_0077720 [Podospora pseudocomata]